MTSMISIVNEGVTISDARLSYKHMDFRGKNSLNQGKATFSKLLVGHFND